MSRWETLFRNLEVTIFHQYLKTCIGRLWSLDMDFISDRAPHLVARRCSGDKDYARKGRAWVTDAG
jgi:hypothetical protein